MKLVHPRASSFSFEGIVVFTGSVTLILLDAMDGLAVREGGQPSFQPQRIAARRRRRSDALFSSNDMDIGLALTTAQARSARFEHGGQPSAALGLDERRSHDVLNGFSLNRLGLNGLVLSGCLV